MNIQKTNISVIIPDEIKSNITPSDIEIVKREVTGTQYNVIKYACRYKEHDMFILTFHNRPRYCGFPPIIALSPSKKVEWMQGIDEYIVVTKQARMQAPSVFKPFIPQ